VLPTKFLAATEDERRLGLALSADDDCQLPLEATGTGTVFTCEQAVLHAKETAELFAPAKLREDLAVFTSKAKEAGRGIGAPAKVVQYSIPQTPHLNLGKAGFFDLKVRELIIRDRTLTCAEPDESAPPWNERVAELVFGDEGLGEVKRPEEASTGEAKTPAGQ